MDIIVLKNGECTTIIHNGVKFILKDKDLLDKNKDEIKEWYISMKGGEIVG